MVQAPPGHELPGVPGYQSLVRSVAKQPGSAAEDRPITLDVAFIVNGSSAGDVQIQTNRAGNALVDVNQMLTRLRGTIGQQLLDSLTTIAAGRAFVPISELNSVGFPLLFDLAALQLRVDVPLDARSVNAISVAGGEQFRLGESMKPSNFAFGASFTLAERFDSVQGFGQIERAPFSIATQGFVNVGGREGAYLTFLGGIREGDSPFRSRTTLFHDDVDRAIRYSIGDIDPLTSGSFASPISIVGIGIERLYQTIQPYRNLRPAGRGGLALERPSRVEVFVNGSSYRTLTLGPGRYDLRDFPFLDGLNDVRLVVQDDTGRNETIGLSFFSDTELLQPGLSIFSATAGFRRTGFGDFSSSEYDGNPTFSGFYQRGVTDRLTLGASLQADKDNQYATALAVVGTPIGLFGLEAAFDRSNVDDLQGALLISYRNAHRGYRGRQNRLDVDFQIQSPRFSPLARAGLQLNPYRYELNARYQFSLPLEIYGSITGAYSEGRGGQRDLATFSAGLARSFGRVNVSLNYGYRDNSSGSDHRGIFSITIPFASRQIVRGTYDTDRNRASIDYNLQAFEGLNQTRVQATLARDDFGEAANIEVEHFSNRFRASLRHTADRTGGLSVHHTDVVVTTGIGYADGVWAIGREADRGFVIVQPHPTLRGADVLVSNRYSAGPTASSGVFGPALVPLQRSYQPDSLEVEVPELRAGYDLGPGRLDIRPGAASGYLWTIGSAASNTVLGRILRADGTPAQLLSGTLRPISGGEAVAVPFFTNRTGRMAASGVAPGRYSVIIAGTTRPVGEITVPENADGTINIGELRIQE
jgi:outer membrane usher protein